MMYYTILHPSPKKTGHLLDAAGCPRRPHIPIFGCSQEAYYTTSAGPPGLDAMRELKRIPPNFFVRFLEFYQNSQHFVEQCDNTAAKQKKLSTSAHCFLFALSSTIAFCLLCKHANTGSPLPSLERLPRVGGACYRTERRRTVGYW